jgi:hypothetical protein
MSDLYIGGVRFGGESLVGGLVLSSLTGWYDTPDDKTDYQERATSYGDFPASSIRRGARVLDLDLGFEFPSRADATAMFHRLNALQGSQQMVRLVDEIDTFCTGTVTFGFPKTKGVAGALSGTVTCTDPFIYSTAEQQITLSGSAAVGKGLSFIPDGETVAGLDFPVSFGGEGIDGSNVGVLTNGGNAPAWPTFTTVGSFPSGFRLELGGEVLEWDQPVAASAPVTLDCRNMRALVLGVDRTVGVSRQGWASVPAGTRVGSSVTSGRLPVVLHPLEASTGYVVARVRDTWI